MSGTLKWYLPKKWIERIAEAKAKAEWAKKWAESIRSEEGPSEPKSFVSLRIRSIITIVARSIRLIVMIHLGSSSFKILICSPHHMHPVQEKASINGSRIQNRQFSRKWEISLGREVKYLKFMPI